MRRWSADDAQLRVELAADPTNPFVVAALPRGDRRRLNFHYEGGVRPSANGVCPCIPHRRAPTGVCPAGSHWVVLRQNLRQLDGAYSQGLVLRFEGIEPRLSLEVPTSEIAHKGPFEAREAVRAELMPQAPQAEPQFVVMDRDSEALGQFADELAELTDFA